MIYLSPSKIAVLAAIKSGLIESQIKVDVVAKRDCICGRCGAPIKVNDMVALNKPSKAFNDFAFMADRFSPYLCEWCPSLDGKGFILNWGNAVASENGMMKLNYIEDRAYAILNPPETPYVMVMMTAKQQHLFWRAPVNLGHEYMRVRMGNSVIQINRPIVLSAYEKIKEAGPIMTKPNGKAGVAKHPFLMLSSEIGKPTHAIPHPRLNDKGQELLKSLGGLTAGDTWALGNLLSVDSSVLAAMTGPNQHVPIPVKKDKDSKESENNGDTEVSNN